MPDQERRVEKVNIGADFTLLRYCEYLPWLAGAGEGEGSPLVSELRPDRRSELETKVMRRFVKNSQSRRRPLLGPSPG